MQQDAIAHGLFISIMHYIFFGFISTPSLVQTTVPKASVYYHSVIDGSIFAEEV
jgi:hypothetical protein